MSVGTSTQLLLISGTSCGMRSCPAAISAKEAFEPAWRQNYQMAGGNIAHNAKRVFCAARNKGGLAGTPV